jgi:aryl-alcohol dehydrogenase-like predicted oxidoreductase
MKQRSFGNAVSVSVLGLGCSRAGSISNPTPMREIEATLEAAIEAGVTLFDTADIYGQGDSERMLGRMLRRHGERIFVVTKVGGRHSRYAAALRLAKPLLRAIAGTRRELRSAVVAARTATVVHDFSPRDLAPAVDASRRRLKRDELQGLLLHDPSVDTLRQPEIAAFLAGLLQTGKARCVGVSIDSLAALEAAVAIPAISIIQAPLALVECVPGGAILEQIRNRNIGIFVREILRRPADSGTASRPPQAALAAAIAPQLVTSAIVGVSTRQHLVDLLPAVQ